MKTIYSDQHRRQHAKRELFGNDFVAPHEIPARADAILAHIRDISLGPVLEPEDFGRAALARVHRADYVDFLATAWDAWVGLGGAEQIIAPISMKPDMGARLPKNIFARIGYYSFDATVPLTDGTWDAAYASAQVAMTAADLVASGEQAAFALCRPPGHHASSSYFGGYCFFNNAALAAQKILDAGAARVAILDVDYHHGNGTQSIFYGRDDVLFTSLHGNPEEDYPFFTGFQDEQGQGAGEGYSLNFPLRHGTDAHAWFAALAEAMKRIEHYGPDAVVVSLGVDAFEGDPISHFQLKSDDFSRIGAAIKKLGRPTVFVMEGGYNLEMIGRNVTNALSGFLAA